MHLSCIRRVVPRSTQEQTIAKVMKWVEDSRHFDTMPSLHDELRKAMRKSIPIFKAMFNRMDSEYVMHCCCAGVPTERCCSTMQEVINKMLMAMEEVMCGLLRAGSPAPCTGKWFSLAVRLR
eukprot:404504-Lingulodinium_polyedra.AAC.1